MAVAEHLARRLGLPFAAVVPLKTSPADGARIEEHGGGLPSRRPAGGRLRSCRELAERAPAAAPGPPDSRHAVDCRVADSGGPARSCVTSRTPGSHHRRDRAGVGTRGAGAVRKAPAPPRPRTRSRRGSRGLRVLPGLGDGLRWLSATGRPSMIEGIGRPRVGPAFRRLGGGPGHPRARRGKRGRDPCYLDQVTG